jgi:hypothetical protein
VTTIRPVGDPDAGLLATPVGAVRRKQSHKPCRTGVSDDGGDDHALLETCGAQQETAVKHLEDDRNKHHRCNITGPTDSPAEPDLSRFHDIMTPVG